MGLTLVEALANFQRRVDTPAVRLFARSIAQGESLGVPISQLMRNLAERDAQAAEGVRRGAGAQGSGQDALPARLPDLPGSVHRARVAGACSTLDELF